MGFGGGGGGGQENPYEHECNIFWPLIYFLKDVTLPYGVVDFLVAPSMFFQNWLGKTLMTLPWIPPANPHLHLVKKCSFEESTLPVCYVWMSSALHAQDHESMTG